MRFHHHGCLSEEDESNIEKGGEEEGEGETGILIGRVQTRTNGKQTDLEM